MALTPVAPGDLITADQFNSLVAELVAHDARLKIVEQRSVEAPAVEEPKWKHVLKDYAQAIELNKADATKLAEIANEMVNRGVPATGVVKLLDDKNVTAGRILEVAKNLPDPPDFDPQRMFR
jgi:hypothetical protein